MRGVAYFLPEPRIQLQVVKTSLYVTEEVKEAPKKSAPVKGQERQQQQNSGTGGAANGAPPAGFDAQAGVSIPPNAQDQGQAQPQAPKTKQVLVGTEYLFKIVKTTLVPNRSEKFMLRYHPSVMARDEMNVKVGSDGLLTKVKMTADDKTDEVIIKLVDVATQLSKSMLLGEAAAKGDGGTIIYDATFNPLTQSGQITQELAARFPEAKLSVAVEEIGNAGKAYHAAFRERQTSERAFSGVAFHPTIPYTLICKASGKVVNRELMLLPDPDEIHTLPVRRSAFVEKVNDLNFDHGMLTEVTVTKPSEALAFMEIPLAMAKAITDIPANLFQVRIDQTKNATAIAEQQQKLFDAQKKQMEAEMALKQLQGAR